MEERIGSKRERERERERKGEGEGEGEGKGRKDCDVPCFFMPQDSSQPLTPNTFTSYYTIHTQKKGSLY